MGQNFPWMTIRDVPLRGKTVLVRADYNVPLKTDGSIADDFRIRASLPTITALLDQGCRVVIISHLGRPHGRDAALSLRQVAARLAKLLGRPVNFIDDSIGPKVYMGIKRAPKPSVTLLDNLRFYPEEKANDSDFARQLAKQTRAQYFVQDGFGVVHRAHASTDAITQFLPSVAGLLLEKEYISIVGAMKHPARPLLAILGGAKVSDKIELVDAFIKVADQIVIGGAMANTFLADKGYDLGKSKIEAGEEAEVKKICSHAARKAGVQLVDNYLVLPSDLAVAKSIEPEERRRIVTLDHMEDSDIALDIGDASIERVTRAIDRARTIIWNGTLGMAELPEFAHGSARAALELAEHPEKVSIIGGGDTADFVIDWDARHGDSFTHVSTGGGASLELMAGHKLPGIEALLQTSRR